MKKNPSPMSNIPELYLGSLIFIGITTKLMHHAHTSTKAKRNEWQVTLPQRAAP